MSTYAWPEDHESDVIVREYRGSDYVADFQREAERLRGAERSRA